MGKENTTYSEHRKQMPSWLKLAFVLAILAAVAICIAIFFTRDLVNTAEGQLEALRNRDFARAYYEFTAKDFKGSTSLESFQEFVKAHPALLHNAMASFSDRSIENHVGTLHGMLTSQEGSVTPIEYKFVKEGDRWKILSMRLIPTGAVAASPVENRNHDLVQAVEEQLDALRSSDIAKAYFGYVSQDFQETTPLKSFKEFIRNYPVLTRHYSAAVKNVQADGKQGSLEAALHSENGSHIVEYNLVNENGRWKIQSVRLNLPSDAISRSAHTNEIDEITDPIEALLANVRAGDSARAYYEYVSKDFQSATSLDAFREFIKAYPILTEHKAVSFESPKLREDTATVVATLDATNGSMPVEYQLIRDGKGWKIWSMQVLSKEGSAASAPSFNTADLLGTIEAQLLAFREKDLSKAYYAYTSKDFQKSTSPIAFERFVEAHDALDRNKAASFTNLSFHNDVGTFQGALVSEDEQTVGVEYDLVYEDGHWRILSIQLLPQEKRVVEEIALSEEPTVEESMLDEQTLSEDVDEEESWDDKEPSIDPQPVEEEDEQPAEEEAANLQDRQQMAKELFVAEEPIESEIVKAKSWFYEAPVEITRIVVGTELDRQGRVRTPRSRLQHKNTDLHTDVYLSNARPGAQAALIMEHVESKTRVPPIETYMEESGNTVLSFIFTPPAHGWPKGKYRLIARTDEGSEKIQEFRMD